MKEFKCAWVENMMSIETDGYTRPCCLETSANARISHISNGILNSFNDKKLIQLKEDLTNGFNNSTKPFCSRCETLENGHHPSLRTTTRFISNKRELKFLQFKMSNKCQLTCAHCGPDRSSGWAKLLNITPHVKNAFEVDDKFLHELREIFPQLEVIKFTGGEPFLDPNHWKILESLKHIDRSNCRLEYITNGVSPFRQELWDGWKDVSCIVSADGYEDSYEWFRRGATWNELIYSVDNLSKYSKVSINYSMTPYTIQDYFKAKDFWRFNFTVNPIVYPRHASLENFPKELIEKIENYKEIPYSEFAKGSINNLYIFKKWATDWDAKWNTHGQANKIFDWMRYV